jgi:predicted membrane channel-forming protein YqfA (hemolysin III family)
MTVSKSNLAAPVDHPGYYILFAGSALPEILSIMQRKDPCGILSRYSKWILAVLLPN